MKDIKVIIKDYLKNGDFQVNSKNLETALNEILAEIEEDNKKKEQAVAEARILDSIAELARDYYELDPDWANEEFIEECFSRKALKGVLDLYWKSYQTAQAIQSELKDWFSSSSAEQAINRKPLDTEIINKILNPITKFDSFIYDSEPSPALVNISDNYVTKTDIKDEVEDAIRKFCKSL